MSNLRGEERLVTVVFADLTESVRRTSELSPEEATELVNPLLEAMVELMVRHGGRIDRFLGDGVLAVFGVPATHEDDPIRAVRAAIALRERAHSLDLSVSAGINTGRVYFGPVGSSLHEELTVMGPTVNLAARLQSAAGGDVVLVGEATEAHVRNAFHLARVTLMVKGLDEPVTGYRAESVVDHPDKVRGIEGLRAGLVGRDTELGILHRSLDGGGQTIFVVGEAGLGKTRLVSELNTLVAARGGNWLEGRCLELTSHVPYAPFIDLLHRHLRTSGSDTLEGALTQSVRAGSLDEERVTQISPYLRELLGHRNGENLADMDPATAEQQKMRIIDAIVT
jgi:class 3 adenylate cyclase